MWHAGVTLAQFRDLGETIPGRMAKKKARSRRHLGAKPPEMAKQNVFTAGESELAVQRRQWLFGLLSLQTYQAGK